MKNVQKWLLLGTLFYVLAMVLLIFNTRQYWNNFSYLSGDEPHYIMLADNISTYGNTNLKESYDKKRYLLYYKTDLFPHVSPKINTKETNEWYSIHPLGLPLLLAFPNALAGVLGARIFLTAIQLSLIPIVFFILRIYLKDPKRYWLGTVIFIATPLYWQNVGAIMPDLIILCLVGVSVLLFTKKNILSSCLLAVTTVLGYLIHTKALLLLGPIFAAKLIVDIRALGINIFLRKHWPSLLVAASGMMFYSIYLYVHYGSINPAVMYGSNGQLFAADPLRNLVAIIMDRSKGLLIYTPMLLIAPIFIHRAIIELRDNLVDQKKRKGKITEERILFYGLSTGLLLFVVTQLTFSDWSGSTAPNGRYMLALVALIGIIIAKYVNFKNRLELALLGGLLTVSILISLFSSTLFMHYMSTGVNSFLVSYFPTLMHFPLFMANVADSGNKEMLKGVFFILAILILNIALIIGLKRKFTIKIKLRDLKKEISK